MNPEEPLDENDLELFEQASVNRRQQPRTERFEAAAIEAKRAANAIQPQRDAVAQNEPDAIPAASNRHAHPNEQGENCKDALPGGPDCPRADTPLMFPDEVEVEVSSDDVDDVGEVPFEIEEDEIEDPDAHAEAQVVAAVRDYVLQSSEIERAIEGLSSEDDQPPTIETTGSVLDRYGRAQRLALATISRTGLDSESALPVLIDIFLESPWPRTQKSIGELASAGATVGTLALASSVRRVWQGHPEFAQPEPSAAGGGYRWYHNPIALEKLSWATAAEIAELWPGYPDIAEVEKVLERLFDEWECRAPLRRRFLNFRLFVTCLANSSSESIEGWLESTLDRGDACNNANDQPEDADRRLRMKEQLGDYGIDLPVE